jgi:hypothetical protein
MVIRCAIRWEPFAGAVEQEGEHVGAALRLRSADFGSGLTARADCSYDVWVLGLGGRHET